MKWKLLLFVSVLALLPFYKLAAQEKADKKSPEETFAKLIKGANLHEGYIDTYEKGDTLYLSVPSQLLGEAFLMKFEIAQGIGAEGLFGGTMLGIFEGAVVQLEKHDGKIFLVKQPHRYQARPHTPTSKAVQLTYGSSVLATAEIKAVNKDSVMLVDAYDWFVSDLSRVSQRVKAAVAKKPGQPGSASFDKSRSYLASVAAFPENVNIVAKLTFKSSGKHTPRSVPDGRYIPVSIHYTLAQLPEEPMTSREADDRVGYFMTVHKNYSADSATFFKRYVNKWRLECEEPAASEGDLCEVKEPIIYYIGRTVPKHYRQAMMEGVEAWNAAFEEAGFRNAIQAKMLPDDAQAADIRYATLRWNTSDQPGYSAIGPSIVDPRTGEILDADILFEANMILGFKNYWRNMVDPTSVLKTMLGQNSRELHHLHQGGELEQFGAHFSNQGMFLRTALIARGKIAPDQPVPQEYINAALKWVTMHEVGHTLGLRHNFRASIDTPLDKLHDKEWTKEHGIYSSVMDYAAANIAPEGTDNGYFYSPGVGSYDRWAVSYGYTPSDTKAAHIARQSALPGHAYGTDEDARGSGAIDPTVNIYDLSAKPLEWGERRIGLVTELIPELPEYVLDDNTPYYKLTDAYQNLLGQYVAALSVGIKYIGGQYQYRNHYGDPDVRAPFVAVDLEKQQKALDLLIKYGFSNTAFPLPAELYRQFGANRWTHWGNTNTFDGRIDYPIYKTIADIQSTFLSALTDPLRLARIRAAEAKYGQKNTVDIPELMNRLTQAIWSEVQQAPGRNITTRNRDLQRVYLDRMEKLLIDAPDRLPSDARSVVRMQLLSLQQDITNRLESGSDFNAYSRAHLVESQARIQKILEASLTL